MEVVISFFQNFTKKTFQVTYDYLTGKLWRENECCFYFSVLCNVDLPVIRIHVDVSNEYFVINKLFY